MQVREPTISGKSTYKSKSFLTVGSKAWFKFGIKARWLTKVYLALGEYRSEDYVRKRERGTAAISV
jgi:hypothetical protein